MLKWILFFICIAGVYFIFFKKPNVKSQTKDSKNPKAPKDSIMLECDKCGTYVSSEEAIIQNGKYYCSKECAQC